MTRKQVRRLFALLPLLALLGAMGCSKGGDRSASVSGKVTYNDKPVTSGTVVFIGADGKASDTGVVQPDGTYSVAHAPTGAVKVSFDNPAPAKTTGGAPLPANDPEAKENAKEASLYVPTPAKYKDPNQSGLTCTLKSGKNSYDVIMR
jgi:ribosomal protein L35AE/L33A